MCAQIQADVLGVEVDTATGKLDRKQLQPMRATRLQAHFGIFHVPVVKSTVHALFQLIFIVGFILWSTQAIAHDLYGPFTPFEWLGSVWILGLIM